MSQARVPLDDDGNDDNVENDSNEDDNFEEDKDVDAKDATQKQAGSSIKSTSAKTGTGKPGTLKRKKSKGSGKKKPGPGKKNKRRATELIPPEDVTEFVVPDEVEIEVPEIVEEVPEPVEIPDFQPEQTVFEMIKKRIVVAGQPRVTLSEEDVYMIEQFIDKPSIRLLVAYFSQHFGFCMNHGIPSVPVKHLCYFIKSASTSEITSQNFLTEIQYGTIRSGHIESLLRVMMGVYAPVFFEYQWPNIIKNDFSLHLHRFLASLTDTRWKLQNKTVLYVTKEGMKIPEAEAAKKKELVQRLEISVIHWARQIKDVLAIQDALEVAENSGPLDEIKFWRNRCTDMSGITEQLEQEGVKHITRVLELAKSSYVGPFLKLSGQIKVGTQQAENNLKYLNLLYEPCMELASAKVNEIPKMLPGILKLIRFVWVNSDFYNTREKVTAIFKKLSNEIIRRCCAEIDLDKIFDGYVQSGKKSLLSCIDCCEQWQNIYDETAKVHNKFSPVNWVLDHDAIFAQVDAFIKRCLDMLEVCEAHSHFARQEEGYAGDMPQFAGHKCNEIVRDLNEIKTQFEKCHRQLRIYKKYALDAMHSSWHDAYRRFQAAVRDLEVMMQNTIATAFKTVRTVQGGVELLEVFVHLSSREVIHNITTKLTTELCRLFIEELNAVKRDMSSKDEYRSPSFPKYAGSACFARMMKNRVQKTMTILERAYFLPKIGMKDDVRVQFKALTVAIDEYIQKTYGEWKTVSVKEPLKLLDVPLMYRVPTKLPKIDINFKGELMKMLQEATYWERLHFELPVYVAELYGRKDHLRYLIELVLLIVRDYNRITSELSAEEQGLFKERLRSLERYIQPGLKKLTWVVKETAEIFLQECRLHCCSVQKLVDSYKMANFNISTTCVDISEYLLVKINPKMIYENLQFEADQAKHRDHVIKKLKEMHESILAILRQSYEVYKNDGPDVQFYWYNYTEKMDKMVEEALRLNIKGSLQELLKAMNGDGKSAPNPLFRLKVILEKDRVEFLPTLFQLASIVEDIGKIHLINTVNSFDRLPDILTKKKSSNLPIFESIRLDEEINKIQNYISASMQNNAQHLQNYMSTWDTYREIWEINKDAFIGRYQKLNPQNSSFDADIARYNEVANNVQMQETILSIQFVLLDCSSLKSAILSHCQEWQNKFTTLLLNIATNCLQDLMSYLSYNGKKSVVGLCTLSYEDIIQLEDIKNVLTKGKDTAPGPNGVRVAEIPQTLDQLVESLHLWDKLKEETPLIEGKFAPLMEQFVILEKYNVAIALGVRKQLTDLPIEWESFLDTLIEAESMLKKQKEIFKAELLRQATELKQQIAELIVEFDTTGPFTSTVTINDAFVAISNFQLKKGMCKELEQTIRHGLNIFNIEHPPSKELAILEKDLENIKSVWDLTDEWMKNWNIWKTHTFDLLRVYEMEETSSHLLKNLIRLSKAFKDKRCEIVEMTQSKVEQIKKTLPIITDLKNHAMRPRHWRQIQDEMNRSFDQTSEEFTLEKIIIYGFDQYSDYVAEVSYSATKELAIEQQKKSIGKEIKQMFHDGLKIFSIEYLPSKELAILEKALAAIATTWQSVDLDIVPYRDKGLFKLGSVEEVYATLEENQVLLTTMKTSRFVKAFEKEVDHWERTVSHILETVEMLMVIQRQWMYMENIFIGDDIRRQLPGETAHFDSINLNWREIMSRLNGDRNALRGTQYPGLLEHLIDMNENLETIRRSLDLYLETKRHIFPRFYFISNDTLLEILGQSRNPELILPYLKHCFDNIKSLKMAKTGPQQKWEATGMFSSDGEYVEFGHSVSMEGQVEIYLGDVEKMMRVTLRDSLRHSRAALKKSLSKRDKWIKDWPGQICVTASQIQWTQDVMKALMLVGERGDIKALKTCKKKQRLMLTKLSETIRTPLSKIMRLKIVTLVTIEVHARDIIEKLLKSNVSDVNSFDWLSQLRYYWEKEFDDCIIRQTTAYFVYGYEYLGNSGRLVITPLTDRCQITISTALNLCKGGCLKGPASTGKTETVKDFGKAMGLLVLIVNCSEGLDYRSMGKLFAGLSQTGAWGSFDEMNRINIEVLSVIAQQIVSILAALDSELDKFVFEGQLINLVSTCGFFITMNPGYSGRNELPENLKALFRPMAMVVPDISFIAEISLFSEGFNNTKVLSKKTSTLYSLAIQQLSKQDHYDFGLRGVVSMLKYAGKKKRALPHLSDDEILCMAVKEMNLPKLVLDDISLFNGIVLDLFPDLVIPTTYRAKLNSVIEEELKERKLQITNSTVTKVFQLLDAKTARHSVMLVGATLSAKTTIWRVLKASINRLNRAGEPFFLVRDHPINPKALTVGELFGVFDKFHVQWNDGVFSSMLRNLCTDERTEEKWIVFDGPVDSMWVESMNSLMDDNRVLTLINGDRITLSDTVSLLFEVEDLAMSSPATVSRACMVYCDYRDLGVMPYLDSWLSKKTNVGLVDALRKCIDSYLMRVMEFKALNCKEPVPLCELNGVISLCRLFDALFILEAGTEVSATVQKLVEMWFQFCLIWSVCSSVDEDGRKKIDNCIREMVGTFPNKDTVYEYYVDTAQRAWTHWEEKLKGKWKYKSSIPFYKLNVPTVDTVRYQYLCTALIRTLNPVLLVGAVGTGKTLVIESTLAGFDMKDYSILTVKMSAQTSSAQVQNVIESRLEKYTKGVFVPVGGKKLISFMDDLNMPAKDDYGYQPPLELMRQWLEYGFWFHRSQRMIQYIKGMLLVSAMGPPGGGRMVISTRLQSRFNLINMTFPQDSQIKRIFGSMITQKLQNFAEEIKLLSDTLTQGTIEIYQAIVLRFLPTPTRIHYLFNLRDISRVFQGLLRANKNYHDSKGSIIRLWMHECYRVFSDRLIDQKDLQSFSDVVSEKLGVVFEQTFNNLCPNKLLPVFGDYMNKDKVYEQLVSAENVKTFMLEQLHEYNITPKTVTLDLVLFKDAVEHISRIVRVIRQPRGNMLLIGINGSGRQSLTRLASFMCNYVIFQIEVSDRYGKHEFREDMKRLYNQTGVQNKPTVFLFSDVQVVEKSFFEDVNCILSSGEVANLYRAEELEQIKNTLSNELIKEGIEETIHSAYSFLIERVRTNLHVVLCMSPLGEEFRNSIRMFPALVNNTSIDWFHEWPADALLEVADKYISGMVLGNTQADRKQFRLQESKGALAQMFMLIHKSVAEFSTRMFLEIRRFNCVSPTNYLELVTGYKKLLFEKAKELTDDRDKLRSGLSKIDETKEKVEKMSVDLEEAKIMVAACQKECEEFLKTLVQQKREADEQQKSVAIKSERIKEEEIKCQALADVAQADLDEAMPALDEANKALESLNKRDMTEIKSYGRPPVLVERVMEAVMILRGSEPTWAESKKQLGDQNFLKQLMNYDKDNITDRILRKIGGYVAQSDFHPDIIGGVSAAAKSLCMWVRAMEMYGRIYRVVEPKRIKLNAALAVLAQKREALAEAKAKLAEVEAKLLELKVSYDEKLAQKEELRRKADLTELMLDRAQRLMSGLHSERVRWEEKVEYLEDNMGHLIGDVLIAAAFLSYLGPFLTTFREEIMLLWKSQIDKLKVPCALRFNFCTFMTKPTQLRDWNIQGLPRDEFSTENGVIVTRSQRWPFLIDPQGQGSRWIKNMEGDNVIDIRHPNYLRDIMSGIQCGLPVLLTSLLDKLDASLNPIFNKSLIRTEGVTYIKFGSQEVEYNDDFRLYLTTKLGNPQLSPQILIKVAVVNFAVMSKGLEAQLLGVVVRKERPELEEQKDSLVCSIAAGKKKLDQCEDEILRLLNETKGSLLDDAQLVDTLQLSKMISQEVSESVAVSEQMEIKIDAARECYRPCAEQASILFFVMNEMGHIDPMYQFALDTYYELFTLSIEKSPRAVKLDERIAHLNEYHLYAVYKYVCRGLFEKHKLIFSFQMCIKLLEHAKRLNIDEYNFFLRGGIVIDRENQMDNPCTTWLSAESWDNVTELDKLTNFHGIITSFEQYSRDWFLWYISPEPENTPLPGEWDKACNELQRMLVVRSLRPDRVSFCAISFIINNLGQRFTEPPILDIVSIIEDSSTRTPLIFIVSPGSDPRSNLQMIVDSCGMASQFSTLSLGQGQASIATRLLQAAVTEGRWVFLANCHLSMSWMPSLSQLVDQLQTESCNPNFRLWLSSLPHPDFPISVLQAGVKITTEHPKGLKAGIKRLYSLITEQQFQRCHKPERYKKLLFALCFFHTILLERKKFKMLGWNIMYEFNDADFEVSEHILVAYLDICEEMQWDAIRYLIANINYGGHVTDDWDRRLLMTYMNDYFCESVFTVAFYKLTSLPTYYIPKDGPLSSYKEYVTMLPSQDLPEVFGQHPNAEISSQIQETRLLFDTLLSLQPLIYSVPGDTTEDKVLDAAATIIKQLPENMDYEGTTKILSQDPSPLNSVLLQEMQRYNLLLDQIRASLLSLERGIQGLTVMTLDLEIIFSCILDGRVPPTWGKTYPSAKPLAAWAKDLVSRVDLFEKWAGSARPPWVFWLSAFTFPCGFLTAVLQMAARQHQMSVDSLTWEFIVQTVDDSNLTGPAKDGVYVKGFFLEGAGWDKKNAFLTEASSVQLVVGMPTIQFKPVEFKKKDTYLAPCYYYSNRTGNSDRPSFIVAVELKSGDKPADHWVKRGTALLMSLDY